MRAGVAEGGAGSGDGVRRWGGGESWGATDAGIAGGGGRGPSVTGVDGGGTTSALVGL
jgi:hypothetical protein